MARLPNPGGDAGSWGQILNDFLGSVHNIDGTLKENTIGAEQLKTDAVTNDHIAPGAVNAASLASDVYINNAVVDGSITAAKLADNAVTAAKVAPGAISAAKIADGTITTAKLADGNITSAKLASGVIDGSKVAAGSISSTRLATSTAPADGQVLSYSSGALVWANQASVPNTLDALSDVNTVGATNGQSLVYQSGNWVPATVTSGGGVTDHGALTGLSDDDHPQYLNNARGDARYFTQAQVTTSLAAKQDTAAKGALNGYAGLDATGKVPTSQLPSSLALVAQSKGVAIYNTGSSSYPARPVGYASVEWIGPVDPGTAAQDYDTWIDTSA